MKKLTIALALVAMAMFANAASFDWKTSARGGAVNGPGTGAALADGTAYLFLASSVESVFADWVAGKALAEMGALDSNAISAGKVANKAPFESGEDPLKAFFATSATVGGKDYLYISNEASADAVAVGSASLQFKETATSNGAVLDSAAGYKGAGWYSAVPEPTGAMLLLLGVAGLALRRKQK